jgi:hypothetical protein
MARQKAPTPPVGPPIDFRGESDGSKSPATYILTRTSLQTKANTEKVAPHDIAHYNCYPANLGEQTTVKAHRERAANAHPKLRGEDGWEWVKRILWWDMTYDDPIVTITPPAKPARRRKP